ncbi:UbiA-like protein EboC [Fibrella forsythiae]|uniref:UbiA-like protein EboC n=1 Tax=Fibrella forsythiae TaxID=2817061 RepID=A0ABS3JMP0_9BACT|nr:UbiA-like protein EboC [Fibrella forsythiae]MBO0951281.1 UbiA-like protein EboC [Fibrella forsythiae]
MLKSFLQLMRPANLVTAVADVLAGLSLAALAGGISPLSTGQPVWLLLLSTVGLYGGGVVLNDVFDAELDAVERPERAIPSGRVTLGQASALGVGLLVAGIASAFFYGPTTGGLAALIAGLAVFYDRYGKHMSWFGPINMGLCRGFNLLLGVGAAGSAAVQGVWWLALVPVIYIAAITMISRDEVHGGKRLTLYAAAGFYLMVSSAQLALALGAQTLYLTVGFVILHLFLTGRPLLKAIQNPIGSNIGGAVKAGVLSLIVMDAAWVSVSGNWQLALGTLLLLPLSIWLAKAFAVT